MMNSTMNPVTVYHRDGRVVCYMPTQPIDLSLWTARLKQQEKIKPFKTTDVVIHINDLCRSYLNERTGLLALLKNGVAIDISSDSKQATLKVPGTPHSKLYTQTKELLNTTKPKNWVYNIITYFRH